jgi:S1-C subfamily serine protease
MIRRSLAVLSFAVALAVPGYAAAQLTLPQIVQRAGPAVVSLKTYDARGRQLSLGSGFILGDGRIVTNAHVVQGAARAEIFDSDGRLLGTASHAEALSGTVDIAVLPRLGTPRNSVTLASEAPPVGEDIVAIGAPEGLTNTVSNGIVSAYREVEGQWVMQITAPLSHGSSGGPVLNRSGEVVGVSVAVLGEGQNLNFAVPLEDVQAVVGSPPGRVAFSAGTGGTRIRPRPSDDDGGLAAGGAGPSTIRVGQPALRGALQRGDAEFSDGGYFDLYTFSARRGQRLTVTLRSDDFDTYLRLAHARTRDDLDWLGEDDDGGIGTNSRLSVTAPADGEYWIAVSAYDEEPGGYELSVRESEASSGEGGVAAGIELEDRWVPAGDADDFERFVDATRITPQGRGVYRVWARSVYAEPYTDDYGDTYDTVVSLMDYDCTGRRWRSVQIIQYMGDRVVWTSPTEPGEWENWVPESVGETTGETACRLGRSRSR